MDKKTEAEEWMDEYTDKYGNTNEKFHDEYDFPGDGELSIKIPFGDGTSVILGTSGYVDYGVYKSDENCLCIQEDNGPYSTDPLDGSSCIWCRDIAHTYEEWEEIHTESEYYQLWFAEDTSEGYTWLRIKDKETGEVWVVELLAWGRKPKELLNNLNPEQATTLLHNLWDYGDERNWHTISRIDGKSCNKVIRINYEDLGKMIR